MSYIYDISSLRVKEYGIKKHNCVVFYVADVDDSSK